MMTVTEESLYNYNERVDYLYNQVGNYPYPFVSMEKRPLPSIMEKVRHHKKGEKVCNLYRYTNQGDIKKWKANNLYEKNGLAIIPDIIRWGKYEGKALVVVDFDNLESLKSFIAEMGYKSLQDLSQDFYVEHHNEEGYAHIIFVSPMQFEDHKSSGLEVYANGNRWIIMSPSRHEDDKDNYTIIEGGIDHISLLSFAKAHEVAIALSTISDDKYNPTIIKDYKLIELLTKYYRDDCHCRHEIIKGLAGLMRKYTNRNEDRVKQFVQVLCNITDDTEAIDDRLQAVEDTYSLEKDDENIAGWSILEQYITNKSNLELIKEYLEIKEYSSNSNSNSKKKKNNDDDSKPSYDEVIQDLYKLDNFVYIEESDQLLYYDRGVYVDNAENMIKQMIEYKYPVTFSKHDKNEIIEHIKDQNGVSINDFIDITKPSLTNMENGFYDMKTLEFVEHQLDDDVETELIGSGENSFSIPKHKTLSTIQHSIKFDPKAKCPTFGKWLRTVCNNNAKDMQTLLALMGNNFYRSYDYPYGLVLVGGANAGKGTFFRLNIHLIGMNNCTSVKLEELINDKFADSELLGKNLNIDTELRKEISVKDFAKVKRLLSNEERKRTQEKFKKGKESPIWCKLFNSGNDFPILSDNDDEAVAKRIIPVSLIIQFWGANDDKDMLKKLVNEASGIFNACRYAWYYFLYKGNDNLPISLEERKDRMQKLSKQLESFLSEMCMFYVKSDDLGEYGEIEEIKHWFVVKEDLFNAFEQWRIDNRVTSVNTYKRSDFYQLIENKIKDEVEYFERNKWKSEAARITDRKRLKSVNSRPEVFYGIRLKTDELWEKELKAEDQQLLEQLK